MRRVSKRLKSFFKILFLLAVLAASAMLYAPLKDYLQKTLRAPLLLPAYTAVTSLLMGALAGFVIRPESGHRGLYAFAAVLFTLFGLLPHLYFLLSLSFLPLFVNRFSEYGQAGWLLTGLFICMASRSGRGRSS